MSIIDFDILGFLCDSEISLDYILDVLDVLESSSEYWDD